MSAEDKKDFKQLLALVTVVQLVFSAVSGGIAGTFKARAEVRDVARDVVNEEWLKTLRSESAKIAADAARQATSDAIREAVVPVLMEFREHKALDDERQRNLEAEVKSHALELRRR